MANRSRLRDPTVKELRVIAVGHGLQLNDDEVRDLLEAGNGLLTSFRRLNVLPEPIPPPTSTRLPGRAPLASENKLGAWQWKTDIVAHKDEWTSGLLEGYTVAVKDNVCIGGIPMSNGSRVLEGFIPKQDASLVRRILEAGGRILGKTVCEDLCLSGGSHTSAPGPVHNPYCYGRSAGGSSSGSTVVVATGDVDMAIGGDQGGSIRIPACCCGVVGFKPSYGLVPYTGVFSFEPTVDHVGPIARDVYKASLLLEAIAGQDGLDARQGIAKAPEFGSLSGLSESLPKTKEEAKKVLCNVRFGALHEGFAIPNVSEGDVDAAVYDTLQTVVASAGAFLVKVSIPEHRDGSYILTLVRVEGAYVTQFTSGGQGIGVKGHFMTDMMHYHTHGMSTRAASLSWTNKLYLLLGGFIHKNYGGEFYGRGQNLVRVLTEAYDNVLKSQCDVLVLPTLPFKPRLLPDLDSCSVQEYISSAGNININTCPFNLTGHPAVTIPAAFIPCESITAKLPVGLMIVGRRMQDADVLKVARAFELLRGDLLPE